MVEPFSIHLMLEESVLVTRMTTRLGGVVAVAVLCLGLAACQSEDEPSGLPHLTDPAPSPTASPSPSPSVEPSEAAIAERAAEAEQRYQEYLEITDRHRIEGTRASQELFDERGLLGEPAVWDAVEVDDDFYADENLKQVGQTRIASIKVTGYDGDPLVDGIGGHRVKFAVCLDYSELDIVREDGTSAIAKGQRDRVFMKVVMQGQEDGTWTVNKLDPVDRKC
ncbi:hypothetical protein ACQEVI_10950 [Promicromonospora sp. CA-289599]|uniref:hypothetical protein n=1 Tax=Promicromonospora sp. CA-289599 TaxID=3240014 RepID=UPI003D9093E5